MLRIEKSEHEKTFWIMSDIDGTEVCVELSKDYIDDGECFSFAKTTPSAYKFQEATPKELYDALMEAGMMEELFKYLESITGK